MYPQPKPRERGIGAIPSLEKIQKITPEWQTERLCSVDSVVSCVKGAHHDGDVVSWTVFFCCQIRWYRELFRPVWRKEPFLLFQRRSRRNEPASPVTPQRKPSKFLPKKKRNQRQIPKIRKKIGKKQKKKETEKHIPQKNKPHNQKSQKKKHSKKNNKNKRKKKKGTIQKKKAI